MKWFERIEQFIKPDLIVEAEGRVYLTRWWLLPKNPLFNIYLHKFTGSDEPTLHDHPWVSVSYVLEGVMFEHFKIRGRACGARNWYFRKHTLLHYLEMVDDQPVWTLFFTGPKCRRWCFLTKTGKVDAREYKGRPNVTSHEWA